MDGVTLSRQYGEFLTQVLDRVQPQIADNISQRIPLFHMLQEQGRKIYATGAKIRVPLLGEFNTTAKGYIGSDTFDTTYQDNVTPAFYDMKSIAATATIYGTDLADASGPEAVIDILTTKIESAIIALQNLVATDIFSTHGETELRHLTGLRNIISATPGTGSTGRIDRATWTWWQNQTADVASAFATNGRVRMMQLYNLCYDGVNNVDLIILTRSAFENYERNTTATVVYNLPNEGDTARNVTYADQGVQQQRYKGSIVVFDDKCPANNGFFINSRYLKLYVNPQRDFATRDFVMPHNQDVMTSAIMFRGNLVANNLRFLGNLLNADTN